MTCLKPRLKQSTTSHRSPRNLLAIFCFVSEFKRLWLQPPDGTSGHRPHAVAVFGAKKHTQRGPSSSCSRRCKVRFLFFCCRLFCFTFCWRSSHLYCMAPCCKLDYSKCGHSFVYSGLVLNAIHLLHYLRFIIWKKKLCKYIVLTYFLPTVSIMHSTCDGVCLARRSRLLCFCFACHYLILIQAVLN